MPVFRVICNECTEAGKDRPAEPLYLPIRLRVIRGSVQIGDSKMAADGLEELAGELPAVIRDYSRWRSIRENPMRTESASNRQSRNCGHRYHPS